MEMINYLVEVHGAKGSVVDSVLFIKIMDFPWMKILWPLERLKNIFWIGKTWNKIKIWEIICISEKIKTSLQIKWQVTDWKKILTIHISDKDLVMRIYKEFFTIYKMNNSVFKWG